MSEVAILEILVFDELSNKQRTTRKIIDIFKLWISTNFESIKQWVNLEDSELIRAQNSVLLRYSWLRIKRKLRKVKKEWWLEGADTLS